MKIVGVENTATIRSARRVLSKATVIRRPVLPGAARMKASAAGQFGARRAAASGLRRRA